jgi:hypothetical protein
MDFSTIDIEKLTSLPQWIPVNGTTIQKEPGNGCSGNPPGHPTYFTRNIYNFLGNNLQDQKMVIYYCDKYYIVGKKVLHALWKPLPLDHERTKLWISCTYKHYKNCYNKFNGDIIIFPVPYYKLKKYNYDERWKEEFIKHHCKEIDEFNNNIIKENEKVAIPENHSAVRFIRKFYPEYQPDLELIKNPPENNIGLWWETIASQPLEKECAATQRWGFKHPFNKTWCQWCGR